MRIAKCSMRGLWVNEIVSQKYKPYKTESKNNEGQIDVPRVLGKG